MKTLCGILFLFLFVGAFSSLHNQNTADEKQNAVGGTICTIDSNKTISPTSTAPEFIGGTFCGNGITVPTLDSLPGVVPSESSESFSLKLKNGTPVMESIPKEK